MRERRKRPKVKLFFRLLRTGHSRILTAFAVNSELCTYAHGRNRRLAGSYARLHAYYDNRGLPRKRKRGKNPCAVTKEDAVSGTAAAAATYPRRNSATATARMVAAACARRTAIAATGKTAAAGAAAAGAAIATIAAATTAKAAAAAASRTGAAGRRASAANCTTARAAILAARCSAACSAEGNKPGLYNAGLFCYLKERLCRCIGKSAFGHTPGGCCPPATRRPGASLLPAVVLSPLFRSAALIRQKTDKARPSRMRTRPRVVSFPLPQQFPLAQIAINFIMNLFAHFHDLAVIVSGKPRTHAQKTGGVG